MDKGVAGGQPRWMRRPSSRLMLLTGLVLLSGCVLAIPVVRFTIPLPSQVPLSGVRSLAVLDFTASADNPSEGSWIAEHITTLFASAGYRTVSPGQIRQQLVPLKLVPSRLQQPAVVKQLGQVLGTDALLFGDLVTLRLEKSVSTTWEQRQVGERRTEEIEVDSAGNTRVVVRFVPDYREVPLETLSRTVVLGIQARLVRTADGTILWEDGLQRQPTIRNRIRDGSTTYAVVPPDASLLQNVLTQALQDLVVPVLPRQLLRNRQLAIGPGDDPYGHALHAGNVAAEKGEWATARYFWNQALQEDPSRVEAQANLGVAFEAAGNWEAAEAAYAAAAEALGKPWTYYLGQIRLLLQQRREREMQPAIP